MSKKTKSVAEHLKALFSNGQKITPAEAIQLAEVITDATELKFIDVKSGDKNLKIEGEIVVDSLIVEVLEDETEAVVEDGDYEITAEGFEPFTITVMDGKISVVGEMLPSETEETEMSDVIMKEINELKSMFDSLKMSAKKPETFKQEFEEMKQEMKTFISVEMSKIPAISQLLVKTDFSKDDKKEVEIPNLKTLGAYTKKKRK